MFNYLKAYCVIGGDFKGHHNVWSSYFINNTGVKLLEAIDSIPRLVNCINDQINNTWKQHLSGGY